MWSPIIVETLEPNRNYLELLSTGKIPAIIIRNFYDKDSCNTIVNRIENSLLIIRNNKKFKDIGSFLMSYITKRKEYFDDAMKNQKLFAKLLGDLKTTDKIRQSVKKLFYVNSVTLASDSEKYYSPCMIRVYKKGRKIPIHKDNVKFEGKEYNIADIDYQLSCVLHLQESESGGDLIIYKKQWERENERFRNIEFGYSSEVIKSSDFCVISNLNVGDLAIINPNYYHKVTEIKGDTQRITLSMFLGIYEDERKIVTWA
ncbi:MAG: hypothetical protein HKM23_07685 [Nitrosopumilus sp.]|nr:hypothetical protein [Nitrosopumilus sp.]NNL58442.1 hypothetical protein [Nitrosopumilus sp.]